VNSTGICSSSRPRRIARNRPERLTKRSEVDVCEVTVEGRELAPIIKHLPNFSTRDVDGSRKVEASWDWMGAAPLIRVGVVAVLGIVLCTVLDFHFGVFGRQSPQPFASVVYKVERPEAKQLLQASADGVQTPITTPSTPSLGFPLPSVYGTYVPIRFAHEPRPESGVC